MSRRSTRREAGAAIAQRVLLAADVAEGSGGVAYHVTALATSLRAGGADVDVFWSGDVPARLPGTLRPLGFSLALGRRARAAAPDVLHAHTNVGGLAHLLAPATTTCITTSHGDERDLWAAEQTWATVGGPPVKPWSRVLVPTLRLPLFTSAVRAADGVIALHDAEGRRYAGERGGNDTVAVVANAARPAPPVSTPVSGRIVFVGSWIFRKGTSALVSAFTAVLSCHPEAELVLVGPSTAALADFPPDVRPSVRALGFVAHDDVDAELSTADVLVLPSLFEGMPLVVLDALARGVPVVATDLPGTRAAVADAGLLVPLSDPSALGEALSRVVGDRDLRAALSERARQRCADWTWDDVATATTSLYGRAAQGRPRRALARLRRLTGRRTVGGTST